MTVEERAKTVTDEVGTATTGAELRALIAQALHRLIKQCAQVAAEVKDHPATAADHDLHYCAGLIERRILALADLPPDSLYVDPEMLHDKGPVQIKDLPPLSPPKQAAVERGIEAAGKVEERWERN